MKTRTKITIFIALVLGISSAIGMRKAPAQNTGGELGVPEHLRPIIGRACVDCHTDQTRWPWYSRVPLVSTFIERDVKKGREHLNFSSWASSAHQPTRNQLQEVCDAVSDNNMPPRHYLFMHPAARLSPADVDAICDWASTPNKLSDGRAGQP